MRYLLAFWKLIRPTTWRGRAIFAGVIVTNASLIALTVMIISPSHRVTAIDLGITNGLHEPVVLFTNGYFTASLPEGESWDEHRFICEDDCLVELTDGDGHVLCAFNLTKPLAASVGNEFVLSTATPPSPLCDPALVP